MCPPGDARALPEGLSNAYKAIDAQVGAARRASTDASLNGSKRPRTAQSQAEPPRESLHRGGDEACTCSACTKVSSRVPKYRKALLLPPDRAVACCTVASNDLHLLDARLEARRVEIAASMSPDAFFTLFITELVLRRYQLGLPAVRAGIVDGSGDMGIDAFYVFVNGQLVTAGMDWKGVGQNPEIEVHIFQTKKSMRFSEEALEKIQLHLPELFDLDRDDARLAGQANPHLLDASRLFLTSCTDLAHYGPRFRFYIHYATRADVIHPNTAARAARLEETIPQVFSEASCRVQFYAPKDLLQLARQKDNVEKELVVAEGPLSSDSEKGQGYVCLVTLQQLYEFICEPGSKDLHFAIFDANVRDHYKASIVNNAIQSTLGDSGSPDFWWLNNGVTIIAPEVNYMGKRLFLRDPQIVNGLQTSNEIHKYFSEGGTDTGRLVLVRLIKASDEGVRDAIIWATNNQNTLPPSALRATDPMQHNLEEYFAHRGFVYDRRKNSYLRNTKEDIDKVISMEFMSQCMTACLLQEPWRARGDVARILDEETYPRIFAEDIQLSTYMSSLLLVRKIRHLLEGDSSFAASSRYVEDYLYHCATVATMLFTRQVRPNATEISRIDASKLTSLAVRDLIQIVAREYKVFLSRRLVPESSAAEDLDTTERIMRLVSRILRAPGVDWPDQPLPMDVMNFGQDTRYNR